MRDQVEDATLAGLARSATVLLTTFRTSGRAVTTPVSVTVRGNRAYIVTATDSGKAARLGRKPGGADPLQHRRRADRDHRSRPGTATRSIRNTGPWAATPHKSGVLELVAVPRSRPPYDVLRDHPAAAVTAGHNPATRS